MPRRKKQAAELTTEEAIKKLFPKKVREVVKKEVGADSKTTIKSDDNTD